MNLITAQGPHSISYLARNSSDNTLILQDDNHLDLIEVSNPFQQFDGGEDIAPYDVLVFTRPNWPEAQIWTLKEGGENVGHVFSLEALASSQSSLLNNKYTKVAGAIVLQRLCLGRTYNEITLRLCKLNERYGIDDIYPENCVVGVISRKRIVALGSVVNDWNQFVLDRLPVFSENGLHLLSEVAGRKTYDSASTEKLPAYTRNLQLSGVNGHLPGAARRFLQEVLLKEVPFQEHPAFRYFLCYQLIEVLIDDLHTRVLQVFLIDSAGKNSQELRALLKKLQERIREKDRVMRLIHANASGQVYNDLRSACNSVLLSLGRPEEGDTAEAIYALRNMLFHDFNAAACATVSLKAASDLFFQVACQLALNYTIPSDTL